MADGELENQGQTTVSFAALASLATRRKGWRMEALRAQRGRPITHYALRGDNQDALSGTHNLDGSFEHQRDAGCDERQVDHPLKLRVGEPTENAQSDSGTREARKRIG